MLQIQPLFSFLQDYKTNEDIIMGGNANGSSQSPLPIMGPWAATQPTKSDMLWYIQNKHIIHSMLVTVSQIRMYCYEKFVERSEQLRPRTIISDWQIIAKNKRDSVNKLIPENWRLDSIPSVAEQRDVTGKYIQQFLSAREIEITETDAVGIVEKTSSGEWKSREVCEAFCHRASLAHQLVSNEVTFHTTILMYMM